MVWEWMKQRLQYEYGEHYGLSFISEVGQFTAATVTLPDKRCEEEPE